MCHSQALTRMYNQPTTKLPYGRVVGALYKSPIDCLWRTVGTEESSAGIKVCVYGLGMIIKAESVDGKVHLHTSCVSPFIRELLHASHKRGIYLPPGS